MLADAKQIQLVVEYCILDGIIYCVDELLVYVIVLDDDQPPMKLLLVVSLLLLLLLLLTMMPALRPLPGVKKVKRPKSMSDFEIAVANVPGVEEGY